MAVVAIGVVCNWLYDVSGIISSVVAGAQLARVRCISWCWAMVRERDPVDHGRRCRMATCAVGHDRLCVTFRATCRRVLKLRMGKLETNVLTGCTLSWKLHGYQYCDANHSNEYGH